MYSFSYKIRSKCPAILWLVTLAAVMANAVPGIAVAGEPDTAQKRIQEFLDGLDLPPRVITSAIGVTKQGTPIPCLLTEDDVDPKSDKFRILLIGGLDGSLKSVGQATAAIKTIYSGAQNEYRKQMAFSAVPCVDPDGILAGKKNDALRDLLKSYPLKDIKYAHPTAPEITYLRRWIGMHAPDLVVVYDTHAEDGAKFTWYLPEAQSEMLSEAAQDDQKADLSTVDSLLADLAAGAPSETGTIAGVRISTDGKHWGNAFQALLTRIEKPLHSAARTELIRRINRTPTEIAEHLSEYYGHDLRSVQYIPAIALIGRVRLGALTDDPTHLKDVQQIAAPYFNGSKPSLPKNPSGSDLSGHLIFCELAEMTAGETRKRYIELAQQAADLGFDQNGQPKPSMPAHSEMSDALFMGGPILARIGKLTGERKYFDQCARHLNFMQDLCWREDGLYRHSPLDEAAWGRGNGFPALGLAICLDAFPQDHPAHGEILADFQKHIAALKKHQDYTGAWHQVIDDPGSYRELSCTCMITYAMLRGMQEGWLPREEYEDVVRHSWQAIQTRIGKDGHLVDVCTGTGKQKSLRDYYDRTAILGRDARGGAMSLLVSTEMARYLADKKSPGE